MPNSEAEQGEQHPTRIDVDDAEALRDWAKTLDTTPEQLREAVKVVGDLAADVEMHLKGTHATSNAEQEARAESSAAPGA